MGSVAYLAFLNGAIQKRKYQALLAASLLLLLSYPYFNRSEFAEAFFDLAMSIVLLSALFSVAATTHKRRLGLGLFMLAFIGIWWPSTEHATTLHVIGYMLAIAFYVFVTVTLMRDVFRAKEVGEETLYGAVCIYVLLGLAWSMVYVLLESLAPGSFNAVTQIESDYGEMTSRFIYFSYTTLTTTGYGDITPATDTARSLVVIEHGIGVLYIAIMMARLVGMYRPNTAASLGNQL